VNCPSCHAPLARLPRARSKCKACNNWMYPSFKSVFPSTLLTEGQHTVAKALHAVQEQSPANARVVSQSLPQLRAAQDDNGGLAAVSRDLFNATEPRDDPAAAEIHWHRCAEVMARLGQDFTWALRRSAEALLDRRMLEAVLGGSGGKGTPSEADVFVTICYQSDACDACRGTGGYESGGSEVGALRFTVAEARQRGILPHSGCQATMRGMPGFCRCRYKVM
jgi:hypothetical protein